MNASLICRLSRRAVPLFATLLLAGPASGQVTTIVTTLTDENDSPAGAEVSLREALRDAPDGGNIIFESPLPGGVLILKSGELAVAGKTVSVIAPGLVIEARSLSRILRVDAGAGLNLTGFTLQNGRPESGGGGAILNNGTLTLTDCVLRDNKAASGQNGVAGFNAVAPGTETVYGGDGTSGLPGGGGGGVLSTGPLTALRCQFLNNSAGNGGHGGKGGDGTGSFARPGKPGHGAAGGKGGAILNQGPLQLTECVFTGNTSGAGGVAGGGGFPTQRSCGADGGRSGDGGAVSQNGSLTVERCTFFKNICPSAGAGYPGDPFGSFCGSQFGYTGTAGSGSAISCGGGTAVLTNSTLVANEVGSGGTAAPGGAVQGTSPLRLIHCTVAANTVTFYSEPATSSSWNPAETAGIAGTAECGNCIVRGNTRSSTPASMEFNFSPGVQPTLLPANSPGTTSGVDLKLSPLSFSTGPLPVIVPGTGSPALQAGAVLDPPPATDQRGLPRPVGAPDLGAVEVQSTEASLFALQAVTFSPPTVAASTTVTLNATSDSSLPVSLELLSGPATLTGSTLTFNAGPGFAVVRASQSGNAVTAPATPVVRVIAAPPNHTIPFTPSATYYYYTGSPAVIALPPQTTAGLPVTWSLKDLPPSGIALNGNTLTAAAIGTVQLRGQFPGTPQYSELNLTWSLSFLPAAVAWNYPAGGSPIPVFTFIEGSPYGLTMSASIPAPHTSPLSVPALPGGLVATPAVLPAGQTSVSSFISLPANPAQAARTFIVGPDSFPSTSFGVVSRTAVPLNITAPASIPAGVSTQVDLSCPAYFNVGVEYFGPPNLALRTFTVSAVDFDNPAVSVPVTLNSTSNGAGTSNPVKYLRITFPPLTDRRVKLTVTTDDGITGQSGPIPVSSDTNTDNDGINDTVETALQRTPGQRHQPPLTIERDAAGMHAVLANLPLNLQGWTVVIEQSTNLQTWTPAPAAATTTTPNPDGLTARVSVLFPANGSLYYVRLRATRP